MTPKKFLILQIIFFLYIASCFLMITFVTGPILILSIINTSLCVINCLYCLYNYFMQKPVNKVKELNIKSENTLIKFEAAAEKFNQAMKPFELTEWQKACAQRFRDLPKEEQKRIREKLNQRPEMKEMFKKLSEQEFEMGEVSETINKTI